MPNCGACGSKLGGRKQNVCTACSKKKKGKKGTRGTAHSRHANHRECKRVRTNTVNHWQLHNATPPTAPPPLPTCCVNCSFLFNNIKVQLDSAQRSEVEVQRCRNNGAVKVNKWNLGQVKQILQPHMLKLSGGAYKQQLCTKCLVIKFGVGKKWPRRYFNKCKDKQQATQTT